MRRKRFLAAPLTRWGKGFLLLLVLGVLLAGTTLLTQAAPPAQSPEEGRALFEQKCTACHTIGGGKLVGPDLQGITVRRERDWLTRWIKAPDKVLAEGDPIATQLLQEFNNLPMPNLGLTDAQVQALIAYLEATQTPAAAPMTLPALYVPTLVASLIALAALTTLGLVWGRKQVEVRL